MIRPGSLSDKLALHNTFHPAVKYRFIHLVDRPRALIIEHDTEYLSRFKHRSQFKLYEIFIVQLHKLLRQYSRAFQNHLRSGRAQ